jgi:hypothetical protein
MRPPRRLASAVVGGVLLAAGLTGCTSTRNSLGTSDNSCYLALPTASAAVHAHGRLLGVHLFTLSSLRTTAPHLYTDLSAGHVPPQKVCVVAYSGTFTRASVAKPLGRSSGKLAVVVSETPSNKLLGTVIFLKAPLHFGHPHLG